MERIYFSAFGDKILLIFEKSKKEEENLRKMSQPIIRPVFNIDLNAKIVPGRVTVGKYDGCHSCLTLATTADKVRSKKINNINLYRIVLQNYY